VSVNTSVTDQQRGEEALTDRRQTPSNNTRTYARSYRQRLAVSPYVREYSRPGCALCWWSGEWMRYLNHR